MLFLCKFKILQCNFYHIFSYESSHTREHWEIFSHANKFSFLPFSLLWGKKNVFIYLFFFNYFIYSSNIMTIQLNLKIFSENNPKIIHFNFLKIPRFIPCSSYPKAKFSLQVSVIYTRKSSGPEIVLAIAREANYKPEWTWRTSCLLY